MTEQNCQSLPGIWPWPGILSLHSSVREEVCLLVAARFLWHIIAVRWQLFLWNFTDTFDSRTTSAPGDFVLATFAGRQRLHQHPQATGTLRTRRQKSHGRAICFAAPYCLEKQQCLLTVNPPMDNCFTS